MQGVRKGFAHVTGCMCLVVMAAAACLMFFGMDARAAEDEEISDTDSVVICIDPGHGGENLGAEWNGYTEKEMTLKVAEAMKERLEQYDGAEVYLTREDDRDMELEERIAYAKDIGADFFFCLHFNMSEKHEIYGAECWVSAFGENYARGMDFSKIEMESLTGLGLFDRGIKTRLNSKGTNYYGILRIGDKEEMPAVIIEHCHLDNSRDEPYYDDGELLEQYGRLDADAAAKYFKLKSETLGNDFSGYEYEHTEVPDECMRPDTTEPDNVTFSSDGLREAEGDESSDRAYMDIQLTASDPETRMNYYSYSLDGGDTWSERLPWAWADQTGENTISFTVPVEYGQDVSLQTAAYNMYDLMTVSDIRQFDALEDPNETADTEVSLEAADGDTSETAGQTGMENSSEDTGTDWVYLAMVAGLALLIPVIIGMGIYIVADHHRHRGHHRKT